MMPTRVELEATLRTRTSGFAELVATALGNTESIEKTLRGLSAESLKQGHHGAAIAPSLVSMRVDALAAYDSGLLAGVSRQWSPLDQLSIAEGLDTDYWLCAWATALRFLASSRDVDEPALESAPFMIRREASAVFGAPPLPEFNFTDLASIRKEKDADLVYRQLDRATFRGRLTRSDLATAVKSDDPGTWQPLRAVRAHCEALAGDAKVFLIDLFEREWRRQTATPAPLGPSGLVCLADIVRTIDPSTFARLPMPAPHTFEPADHWAPVLYLVLRTQWTAP
jgi:hypothetical protein